MFVPTVIPLWSVAKIASLIGSSFGFAGLPVTGCILSFGTP
jgi:hypothetical protein